MILIIRAKADKYALRRTVNFTKERNLVALLFVVVLVDADAVCPQCPWFVG
jgi:hypothetical protein